MHRPEQSYLLYLQKGVNKEDINSAGETHYKKTIFLVIFQVF